MKIHRNIHPDTNTEVINAEGLHIYPGFIDAHSHIGIAEEQTTAQTDCSNEGTNPITPFLRAITIDAAKICRVDHRLGSLKVGKDADLVVFDGNSLEICSSVCMTIIDGRVVWPPK